MVINKLRYLGKLIFSKGAQPLGTCVKFKRPDDTTALFLQDQMDEAPTMEIRFEVWNPPKGETIRLLDFSDTPFDNLIVKWGELAKKDNRSKLWEGVRYLLIEDSKGVMYFVSADILETITDAVKTEHSYAMQIPQSEFITPISDDVRIPLYCLDREFEEGEIEIISISGKECTP